MIASNSSFSNLIIRKKDEQRTEEPRRREESPTKGSYPNSKKFVILKCGWWYSYLNMNLSTHIQTNKKNIRLI